MALPSRKKRNACGCVLCFAIAACVALRTSSSFNGFPTRMSLSASPRPIALVVALGKSRHGDDVNAKFEHVRLASLRNKKIYAALHGYDVIAHSAEQVEKIAGADDLVATWVKIYFLRQCLETYVLCAWFDMDIAIMDLMSPLERFWPQGGWDTSPVVSLVSLHRGVLHPHTFCELRAFALACGGSAPPM